MSSTRTRVHARIPNGHPREEKSVGQKSADKSASCRVRRTHRLPREVGEEVRVGVGVRVGLVEFKLNCTTAAVYTDCCSL